MINIYVPNGNPVNTEKYVYKLNWLNSFIKTKKILSINKNIIIGGDFNVIPEKNDVYDYKNMRMMHYLKTEIRKNIKN